MTYLCTSLFKNTGQKIEARATICCAALIDAGGTSFPWSSAAVNRQEPGVGTHYVPSGSLILPAEAHCLPMDACHHPLSSGTEFTKHWKQELPKDEMARRKLVPKWWVHFKFGGKIKLWGLRLNPNLAIRDRSSQFEQGICLADSGLCLPTLYTKSSHLIKGRFWRLGELSVEKPHRWKCTEEWIALV